MWYNRLKISKDDVGSIVKPTSSLVWADVIRADFQTVISHYLRNIIIYLFCAAQRQSRTIFMQKSKPKYACLPSKIVEVWFERFCVRYDWWRRLQQTSSVFPVWDKINLFCVAVNTRKHWRRAAWWQWISQPANSNSAWLSRIIVRDYYKVWSLCLISSKLDLTYVLSLLVIIAGTMDPQNFEMNFAVPSVKSLRKISDQYKLDAEDPGFLNRAISMFAEVHRGKDIKLALDGKKLAFGIGDKLGEEDLCGHEQPPTLGKLSKV